MGELKTYWDPAGEVITRATFWVEDRRMAKKFGYYVKNPKSIRWKFLIYLGLTLVANVVCFGVLYAFVESVGTVLIFPMLFVSNYPLVRYVYRIRKLQCDAIKKMIANRNNWIYNPSKNYGRWKAMNDQFPEIFSLQEKERNPGFEDEFWGEFKGRSGVCDFYSGVYHCSGRSEQSTEDVFTTVHAIRLNKTLKNSLFLQPENKNTRFWENLGVGTDIALESHQFNEAFRVIKNGALNQVDLIEIFKQLSPTVQEQLVALVKENPDSSIYFGKDTFFFTRKGGLFPKELKLTTKLGDPSINMQTNFLWKVEVNPKDEAYLQERFETLFNIASNVAKYLE